NTARTRIGQHTLASWFLAPATPDQVHARQKAVEELRNSLDLREDLALLGEEIDRNVDPRALNAWAARPPVFESRAMVYAARTVFVAFLLSLVLSPLLGPLPAIVTFAAGLVLLAVWRGPIHEVTHA